MLFVLLSALSSVTATYQQALVCPRVSTFKPAPVVTTSSLRRLNHVLGLPAHRQNRLMKYYRKTTNTYAVDDSTSTNVMVPLFRVAKSFSDGLYEGNGQFEKKGGQIHKVNGEYLIASTFVANNFPERVDGLVGKSMEVISWSDVWKHLLPLKEGREMQYIQGLRDIAKAHPLSTSLPLNSTLNDLLATDGMVVAFSSVDQLKNDDYDFEAFNTFLYSLYLTVYGKNVTMYIESVKDETVYVVLFDTVDWASLWDIPSRLDADYEMFNHALKNSIRYTKGEVEPTAKEYFEIAKGLLTSQWSREDLHSVPRTVLSRIIGVMMLSAFPTLLSTVPSVIGSEAFCYAVFKVVRHAVVDPAKYFGLGTKNKNIV